MLAIGQQGVQAADSAAAEAAREETAKRVAAAEALGAIRTGDVSAAQAQQQANDLQAQIDQSLATGNVAQANALKQRQAELNVQVGTTNASNTLDTARLRADVAQGNAARTLTAGTTNAAAATSANAANAAAANARSEAEAARKTAVNVGNVQRTSDIEQANLNRGVQVATGNADRTLQAGTTTAANLNAASQFNSNQNVDVQQKNVQNAQQRDVQQSQNELQAQNLRITGQNQGTSTAIDAANLGQKAAEAKAGAATAQQKAENDANERLVKTGTTIGMAAASDKRAKTDVDYVSDDELQDLAEKMKAVTFRYKPGIEDGGEDRHAGVMAQDLERSKLGRELVSEDEEGLKRVDYGGLAAMMAAAAARSLRKRDVRA
jgi:hypothetical protein